MKLNLNLILFILLLSSQLYSPSLVNACDAPMETLEDSISTDSYIGIVEIKENSYSETDIGGVTYKLVLYEFVDNRTFYSIEKTNNFYQQYVSNYEEGYFPTCTAKADQYIGKSRVLEINKTYLVVLNKIDEDYKLILSVPVKNNKLEEDFLSYPNKSSIDTLLGDIYTVIDDKQALKVEKQVESDKQNQMRLSWITVSHIFIIVGVNVLFIFRKNYK